MSNAIEEAAAKAAGKFGVLQATVRGLQGVFRRLAQEHKEVAILLKRAGATSDVMKRAKLWAKVHAEVTAHERAELKEVYPDFEVHPALVDVAAVHELEASELKHSVEKLQGVQVASPQWVSMLRAMEHVWTRHAQREENDFFPRIQGVIGNTRALQLEVRYAATKSALLSAGQMLAVNVER